MDKPAIITNIAAEVRRRMEGEGSGHDWWHVYRVWKVAERIAKEEAADLFVVELAALLHDIADWKFNGGDETAGPRVAKEMCIASGVSEEVADHVAEIVGMSGWKGGKGPAMRTVEGMIVQDADRLEAIGAIGIARTFAYGGHKNRPLHDPEQKPATFDSKEAYLKHQGGVINHFYEKLLLLKDRMNTKTGKAMAEGRHRFMEEYLDRFFKEWEGTL